MKIERTTLHGQGTDGAKFQWCIAILLGVSLLSSSDLLWAQSDRGVITGTVTDPSAAAIADASVTAINSATGVSARTTTSKDGAYTIPFLPTGTYQVTVGHAGFKSHLQNGVVVEVGQTTRLDIAMELGSMTETIEVRAAPVQLRPDTSDLGTVISGQQVVDLPLAGHGEQRNPAFFMIMTPGVTGRGLAYGKSSDFNVRFWSTTVSGSQSASNEFHLDGSIIASAWEVSADFRMLGFPPDAVGEFKITTINAPAEYGRSGGGITSFTLKSGTNQLHGSAYEYFRNEKLDAVPFFVNSSPPGCYEGGIPKACRAINKQNEFGVTAGGPIRKNRTFFFGWYNGFFLRKTPTTFLYDVPPEAFKTGDFSALLGPQLQSCGPNSDQPCSDALGRPILQGTIYDPLTTQTVNGQTVRDPFPGNVIPADRFDSVAKNILPFFPKPTNPAALSRNLLSTAPVGNEINQWGTRIDHAVSDRSRLNGSFVWSKLYDQGVEPFPGPLNGNIPTAHNAVVARLSHDWIVRPNLVDHTSLGFNRFRVGSLPSAEDFGWPAKIGFKGVNQNGLFPWFQSSESNQSFGVGGINFDAQNNFDLNESLSWIKGRHTIKFGFEYLKMQSNDVSPGVDSGGMMFSSNETGLPGPPQFTTGSAWASFLLGLADSGRVSVHTSDSRERSGYWAGYAQDDFKITPRLTLNYGLRYELYRPTVDAHNRLSWMDPILPNPALGGFPGTMVFATPERRTGVDQYAKSIGPRLGFAYQWSDKTVARASYGIFWAAGGYVRANRGAYLQGYNAENDLISHDQGLTPAFVMQDGWPADRFPLPPFIDPSFGFNTGVHILNREDARPPYLQNWMLNFQRRLTGQTLLDVAYVGNKGTHLQSRLMPTNHMPTQYLSLGDLLFQNIADPTVQALSVVQAMPLDPATGRHAPFAGYEALLGQRGFATLGQALRTFPQYSEEINSQIRRFYEGVGVSTYHALQVKVDKRFSKGLTFLAAYTWSKTLTDAESQFSEFSGFTADAYNRKAEKSYSINDYPHNLVMSYAYELPFGPGKRFANVGGAAGKIVGGWKVAGIQQYQSGAPGMVFTLGNTMWPFEGSNGFMSRPNVVPGVPQKSAALLSGDFDPNQDLVWNPEAWKDPAPWTFGNGPRTYGNLRRFAYLNEDISIIKRTAVNDRVSIEFRADFLNILNRTVFGLGTGGDQYGAALNELFGTVPGLISSQSNYPRAIQFGLRINY